MMDVARLNKQKSQLWWTVTILMIMCMYWLSNVVLWVPWSHNPQLGILLMLTVNPLFWAAGIYICLASENRTGNLMKKALVVASLAVGISLISDYLFFAVYMGSKDVWHITTFYGYAWLVILALGEAFFLRKSLLARCYVVTVRVLLVLVGILLCLWILQYTLV
mgnify:CR=1 FL=1